MARARRGGREHPAASRFEEMKLAPIDFPSLAEEQTALIEKWNSLFQDKAQKK